MDGATDHQGSHTRPAAAPILAVSSAGLLWGGCASDEGVGGGGGAECQRDASVVSGKRGGLEGTTDEHNKDLTSNFYKKPSMSKLLRI